MSTNIDYIKKLLQLYFNAQTNEQEEAELKDYFAQDLIHPSLLPYKPMFDFYKSESHQEIVLPDSRRISELIERADSKKKNLKLRISYASMAAILASVMLISGLLFKDVIWPPPPQKNTQNAIEAFAQVSEVMSMISEKLNKGFEPLEQLAKVDEGTNALKLINSIGSGLESLQYIMPGNSETTENIQTETL